MHMDDLAAQTDDRGAIWVRSRDDQGSEKKYKDILNLRSQLKSKRVANAVVYHASQASHLDERPPPTCPPHCMP